MLAEVLLAEEDVGLALGCHLVAKVQPVPQGPVHAAGMVVVVHAGIGGEWGAQGAWAHCGLAAVPCCMTVAAVGALLAAEQVAAGAYCWQCIRKMSFFLKIAFFTLFSLKTLENMFQVKSRAFKMFSRPTLE